MQLILDDEVGARPLPQPRGRDSEKGARLLAPGEHRELVDRSDDERRRPLVDVAVDLVDGQAQSHLVLRSVEGACLVRAPCSHAGSTLSERLDVVAVDVLGVVDELAGAPRAPAQQERTVSPLGRLVVLELRHSPVRAVVGIGCAGRAQPRTHGESPLAEQFVFGLANSIKGADKRRGPLQLLGGEEPQRVAHEDGGVSGERVLLVRAVEPSPENGEGSETQVRLRLATSGGHPDDVDGTASAVIGLHRRSDASEDKGDLESTPGGFRAEQRVGGLISMSPPTLVIVRVVARYDRCCSAMAWHAQRKHRCTAVSTFANSHPSRMSARNALHLVRWSAAVGWV